MLPRLLACADAFAAVLATMPRTELPLQLTTLGIGVARDADTMMLVLPGTAPLGMSADEWSELAGLFLAAAAAAHNLEAAAV